MPLPPPPPTLLTEPDCFIAGWPLDRNQVRFVLANVFPDFFVQTWTKIRQILMTFRKRSSSSQLLADTNGSFCVHLFPNNPLKLGPGRTLLTTHHSQFLAVDWYSDKSSILVTTICNRCDLWLKVKTILTLLLAIYDDKKAPSNFSCWKSLSRKFYLVRNHCYPIGIWKMFVNHLLWLRIFSIIRFHHPCCGAVAQSVERPSKGPSLLILLNLCVASSCTCKQIFFKGKSVKLNLCEGPELKMLHW